MPTEAVKVKELWNKGVSAQRRLITNLQVNTAFVFGDQWVYAEGDSNVLKQVHRDADRVQATINRLLPSTRITLAKLHKRPLVWEVPPPGSDDASVRQAKRAEAIVAATAGDQSWEDVRIEADSLTWLGGTAVLWVDWDAAAGEQVDTDEQGRAVGIGDVCVTASSVAQTVIEPGARDARRARWAIRGVAIPPEEARDTYKLDKVPQADAQAAAMIHDVTRRSADRPADLTMVYHYYRRPSATDKGEMAVVIGNQVVQSAEWPYPWTDHLPLAVQRETTVAGQWAGETVMSSAIQIQAGYNMAWSSLLEHVKLAGNARGLMPEGNLDLLDELTDSPGEWLVYRTDAGAPGYLSPPQLPQWVIDSPAMLRRELDDVLGTQDVSRGAAPSNIESGLGLQILVEEGDSPVTQMAAQAARAWSQVASDVLSLYEEHATETRKARVRVPGRPTEETEWKGADLEGVTDAYVPLDQVVPKSHAAQMALAVKLWELGIVQDPEVVADIGDLPDKESFIAAINPDAAKAEDENYDMATGAEPSLEAFDNHAVHIKVHNTFRKGRRYRSMDDAQRAVFDDHVVAHEDMARDEQADLAAEQMVSPTGDVAALASEADLLAGAPPATASPTAPLPAPPEMGYDPTMDPALSGGLP